jgi:hypothetical protein
MCPLEVCTAIGEPATVTVWPSFTVVESPMTKSPPDGSGLTITFDGPTESVAIGIAAGELLAFVSTSCAGETLTGNDGAVPQPVAVISTTGEHPRQGSVIVKSGSGISWWPSGSPGLVLGAGIGWRPSCVDVMPVGNIVGTTLVPLVGIGKVRMVEGTVPRVVDCGTGEIGAEGTSPVGSNVEAIDEGTSDDMSGADGAVGVILEDRGADGMRPVGKRAIGSDGIMLEVRGAEGMRPVGNFVEVLSAAAIRAVPSTRNAKSGPMPIRTRAA